MKPMKPNKNKCLDLIDPGMLELNKKLLSNFNIEVFLILAKQDVCPTCALYLTVRTLVADLNSATTKVTLDSAVSIVLAAVADHYDVDLVTKVRH
jgi:hypothetical protein